MINAERIVNTLDEQLDHEVSLVIYGRAAVALGFTNSPEHVNRSLDVDVILRKSCTAALDADHQFWNAQAKVNELLDKDGLYMTHLFGEEQVFLRIQWESEIVPVLRPTLRHLRLFRPATLDLILTKMMRGNDEQDMQDVDFMIRHDRITRSQIEGAFRDAVIPEGVELHDAYDRAKPTVLAIAQKAEADGFSLRGR